MSKRFLSIAKIILGIVLSAIFLYLVFRNIEWIDFWEKTKRVDYSWVVYSILLSIIAYVARAYRWNILLEPMGYQLKTPRTLLAVLVGYLANLAIPRLGEVTRCGILNRNDGVSMSKALGSVITERLIDLLTLLLLIFGGFLIEGDRLFSFLIDAYSGLNLPGYFVWLMLASGVAVFIFLLNFIRKQRSKGGKFLELINNFLDGLMALRKVKKPIGFLVATLLLWVVYYFMAYIIVFALPETSNLDLSAGLMLLITGGIALSLPVQSGFGTYHGMVAGMLALYGINKTTGVFLATLLHTSQIVAVAIFGSIALVISIFIQRKKHG